MRSRREYGNDVLPFRCYAQTEFLASRLPYSPWSWNEARAEQLKKHSSVRSAATTPQDTPRGTGRSSEYDYGQNTALERHR